MDNFAANDKQLIMFISGESGTGKTMLANMIAQGAQCMFNTFKQDEFNKQSYGSVICTAHTGLGAFKIEGHLWQRVLEKPFRYFLKKLSTATIKKLQDRFKHVRVFILDEVNLVSLEDLQEINFRLCTATGDFTKPFGGLHLVMLGDFYQLHAVQGTAIVRQDKETFNPRALQGEALFRNEMTHYVCLTVNHKRNGLLGPLAAMVRAAREEETSSFDLKEMNTMVLHKLRKAMRTTSHSSRIQIEDRHKKGNEMVNRYMLKLELELRSEVLYLIAYHKPTETWRSRQLEIATKKSLFSVKGGLSCGGDVLSRPLIAPLVIDVRVGSRVRLTANILPCAGLFHGAVGTVVGVIYRGEGPNHSILSCLASKEHELPMILVRMDGDDDTFPCSCMNDVSRVVPIIPVASKQRIVLDNGTGFIRYQIPIIALSRAPTSAGNSPGHSHIIAGLPDFRQGVNTEYDRLNSTFAADSSKRRMM